MAKTSGRYEVHTHSFVRGPFANGGGFTKGGVWKMSSFSHSHEGGDQPHAHPDTGPSCYTIDKDDWFRRTGMRGGGRKTFTAKPSGEQMPVRELESWQTTFRIIVHPPSGDESGNGPGVAPAVRMVLGFGMTATVEEAS